MNVHQHRSYGRQKQATPQDRDAFLEAVRREVGAQQDGRRG